MQIISLSPEPIGKLHSWLPSGLNAEKIVFLPDACLGKAPLPTGTAVLTYQKDWRRFAISDCGCGVRLLRSHLKPEQFSKLGWNNVANAIRSQKGTLGDLGGGNHFLDALSSYSEHILYFLIHTGSRSESGLVDNLTGRPKEFDLAFKRITEWAEQNRATIQKNLEDEFGKMELVLDLPHNTFEMTEDGGIVIRKGAVRLKPNDLSIIPSHISGDAVLIQGTEKMKEIIFSMSHGTGRAMSRAESKKLADEFNFAEMRQDVLFPDGIEDASLRTEGPYAYRELDSCLNLLATYVEEVEKI